MLSARQVDLQELNRVSGLVVEAAIEVHRNLGPGLWERPYADALAIEITRRGLSFEREVGVRAVYDGLDLGYGYRIDFVVEDVLVVELKAADSPFQVHVAQLLTYLRLADKQLGLILNFDHARMIDGIRRVLRSRPEPP